MLAFLHVSCYTDTCKNVVAIFNELLKCFINFTGYVTSNEK
jgi:hypothetical protein